MSLRLNVGEPLAKLRDAFSSAEPFPHLVIDGLFPDEDLERVLQDFPSPRATDWRRFDGAHEKKLGYHHEATVISPVIRSFLDALNAFEALLFLESVTGIDGLIPDPYFGGGGLHQIEPGGFLDVHVDFNIHPKLRVDRRLNLLIYLNKDWREEYGGHLELWDRAGRSCVKRILPTFNRTVLFATSEVSFHGHPIPLTCPPHLTRKSVSLYYYTCGRPADERAPSHDTIFIGSEPD